MKYIVIALVVLFVIRFFLILSAKRYDRKVEKITDLIEAHKHQLALIPDYEDYASVKEFHKAEIAKLENLLAQL